MDLRELRCFVAVAEELHFGRAAERLGISQPPLSRTISQLERRLGVSLLARTSRSVELTPAGRVLLTEAPGILGAVTAAQRRTRQAATGKVVLVLAAKAGASDELLAKLLDAYAAEPAAVPVEVVLCEPQQQHTLLMGGQVDVALIHPPFDSMYGLDTEHLFAEGQVAVLPSSHPLAARVQVRTVEVDDIAELPLARWPQPDGTYPNGPGPAIHDLTQLFQLIALGRATAVLPASVCNDLRRDIAAVPIVDAPAVSTVIAWRPESRSRDLASLIRVALNC